MAGWGRGRGERGWGMGGGGVRVGGDEGMGDGRVEG